MNFGGGLEKHCFVNIRGREVRVKNVAEVVFVNIRGREVRVKNVGEVVFVNIRG
jgi:hypothetical protein